MYLKLLSALNYSYNVVSLFYKKNQKKPKQNQQQK